MRSVKNEIYYNAMMVIGVGFLLVFSIVPMFGVIIAFQDFVPARGMLGSAWVGLKHFNRMFALAEVRNVIRNTLVIALSKIILNIIVPVSFAVLLNELKIIPVKRVVQTVVYLPHFLSWVILGIMFTNIFSYTGIVNQVLGLFGVPPQMYMISNGAFRGIIIGTDVWKTFGYGAIIYLAAITNIDPNVYEAAAIDGAGRWQRIWYVTLPSIQSTIVLMSTLALGSVLNAGFDQIFTMYSPLVYATGDIIDTYVYRMGITKMQYSFSTAVGLFKSAISFILITLSYTLANKFADYTIF
ncbi:MAG: ABC transporter permease subunit [Oscillospiraceae bacterium]|jgi:putative aldouronate transport system permease protein|nr:ABC transporter permease subunit [Oscillospiraceae bacterium]